MWSSPLHQWTLPVITNVPYTAPVDIIARPLDGNVSNQTLYSESWISGAQRWSWRAESGDWRIMTVDWPEALDTGGTAIIDVDWDNNPYTDIDVLWMSQTPHGYFEEDPVAYGNSTFYIEERSINNHRGSGRHDWGLIQENLERYLLFQYLQESIRWLCTQLIMVLPPMIIL